MKKLKFDFVKPEDNIILIGPEIEKRKSFSEKVMKIRELVSEYVKKIHSNFSQSE